MSGAYADAPEGEINLDLIDHLASFEKSVMCGIEEPAESIKASGLWRPIVVRVKAYKMQLEALKNQGKRNDLIRAIDDENNFSPSGAEVKKGEARDIVAELNHTSNAEISRYIRINELINELLDLVDDKEIPFRAAVELSYLSINEQRALAEVIKANEDLKITIALAEQLRSISKNQEVTEDVIDPWVHPEAEETDKLVIDIKDIKMSGFTNQKEKMYVTKNINKCLK